MTVEHDTDTGLFYVETPEGNAELKYRRVNDETVDMYSTFVPRAARGEGVAAKLAEAAIGWAEENNLKVKASCSYVESYLKRRG